MTVEITIVGIRNYLANGKDDYPLLFARLPIGSVVYLRKEPTGSQYPGSVSVWDDDGQQIGSVSKTERRYIELEIPENEMLPVCISGHSAEHNCLFAKAENTKGFSNPFIRDIQLMEDETVFPITAYDQKIRQLTSMMMTKINMLKDGKVNNTKSLLTTASDYAKYCCKSLDGETSFSRSDILQHLRSLMETYPEIHEVYSCIYEQHKDIGRKNNDVKTQVFVEQYERIKEQAACKDQGGRSPLDDYLKKLEFSRGGSLSEEDIQKEILCLSELLSNEMMKSYEKNTGTDETFANALYSLNYGWNGIYRLYTRRIKLEFLKRMGEQEESPETTDDSIPDIVREVFVQPLFIERYVRAMMVNYYTGETLSLALIYCVLNDYSLLKSVNSYQDFVKALVEWGMLKPMNDKQQKTLANGVSAYMRDRKDHNKIRPALSSDFRNWTDTAKKQQCEAIASVFGKEDGYLYKDGTLHYKYKKQG